MNSQTTTLADLSGTLVAHSANGERLLLAILTASEVEQGKHEAAAKVALVIDRSGSMSGDKLRIAKEAVSRLIRSLGPNDQVAVVAYDDKVDIVGSLQQPSEALARRVESVEAGGSTNLYGGWLAGAKLVGAGGRVILLSDGLANVGAYRSAAELAGHAELSYEKFQVTTTTIGVGSDYDEALMAGMARKGGGSHYFAQSAESIMEAFGQERFSIGQMALSHVSVRIGTETRTIGHLWSGESKRVVFEVPSDLASLGSASVQYTVGATGETRAVGLDLPVEFGISDEATLERLIEQGAELEDRSVLVRDSRAAADAAEELRELIFRLLLHPLSDGELAKSVKSRLDSSRERLLKLAREFDEQDAMMHRKRSMQSSFNMRDRAKAYSSFEEERQDVMAYSRSAHAPSAAASQAVVVDPNAVRLAPIEMWREWRAIPSRLTGRTVSLVLLNPKDGFLIREIEKRLNVKVRPEFRHVTEREILDALLELESAGF